jgi:hypothetical protein
MSKGQKSHLLADPTEKTARTAESSLGLAKDLGNPALLKLRACNKRTRRRISKSTVVDNGQFTHKGTGVSRAWMNDSPSQNQS